MRRYLRRGIQQLNKLLALCFDDGFDYLVQTGRSVYPRYRFKWPQMDWWDNDPFTQILRKFGEERGLNTDRRWMLYQLVRLTQRVAGDSAECGVYHGLGSYLICLAQQELGLQRTHWTFDSFDGLSDPKAEDGTYWHRGALRTNRDIAEENLRPFDNVHILDGWIPTRFAEVADRQFSLVHIDVDLYEPTRDSIEFFYPRLSPGGLLIVDDYGCGTCPGATKAVVDYLADKPEKQVAMSGGGCFVVKL